MSDDKMHMCPLFPDQPCPQGKDAAEACAVRVNGEYDPVSDFKDFLIMHCAIHKSNQNNEKQQ